MHARKGEPRKSRVLIIGAGIAGLAAAKTLVGNGIRELTLLEGRKRVGGRIFTDFIGPDGKPINVGAHFIHGCDTDGCNLLLDFCRRHNISTVDATHVKEVFYTGEAPGQTVADDAVERASDLSKKLEDLILSTFEPTKTLSSAVKHAPEVQTLPVTERKILDHMMSDKHAYAATAEDISVAGVRDQLKRHHHRTVDDHSCGDRILPAGFGRIIENLAHGLASSTHLGVGVRAIRQGPDGCEVETNTGELFHVDVVIVTVSLGVLKSGSIKFEPPLSETKTRAIDRLGFGVQNRVYLTFSSVFWDNEAHTFHCCSDPRFRFFNMSIHGLGPLLSVMVMPPYSKEIEKLSDKQIVDEVLQVLQRIFGKISAVTSHKVTRWGADPYARGSFSFIPAGSSLKEVRDLAAPEGRILFAGEATSDEEMQMARGGFTSGIRAGHEAMAILRPKDEAHAAHAHAVQEAHAHAAHAHAHAHAYAHACHEAQAAAMARAESLEAEAAEARASGRGAEGSTQGSPPRAGEGSSRSAPPAPAAPLASAPAPAPTGAQVVAGAMGAAAMPREGLAWPGAEWAGAFAMRPMYPVPYPYTPSPYYYGAPPAVQGAAAGALPFPPCYPPPYMMYYGYPPMSQQ